MYQKTFAPLPADSLFLSHIPHHIFRLFSLFLPRVSFTIRAYSGLVKQDFEARRCPLILCASLLRILHWPKLAGFASPVISFMMRCLNTALTIARWCPPAKDNMTTIFRLSKGAPARWKLPCLSSVADQWVGALTNWRQPRLCAQRQPQNWSDHCLFAGEHLPRQMSNIGQTSITDKMR